MFEILHGSNSEEYCTRLKDADRMDAAAALFEVMRPSQELGDHERNLDTFKQRAMPMMGVERTSIRRELLNIVGQSDHLRLAFSKVSESTGLCFQKGLIIMFAIWVQLMRLPTFRDHFDAASSTYSPLAQGGADIVSDPEGDGSECAAGTE